MTLPAPEPSKQPTSAETPSSKALKFSKQRLALAFAIAGISDAIGALVTPLPPIGWVADIATALLLFLVLAGSGCCCRDLLSRPFQAWAYFHSGCWSLERLPSWALLDRGLN